MERVLARAVRRQRPRAGRRRAAPVRAHRAEHGRQVHLPAPDRAHRADGADGQLRARARGQARPGRPHLHARGRERPDPARPVHLHGRDAGDRPHPAPRERAQPGAARRDRPRHRHLRRPLDRLGGGRAPRAQRGVGPKTLFATHYHELVDLAADIPGVGNLHVSAREWQDSVVFLRKIEPGGSDRSFGIQVARLAGLPAGVVVRAQEILGNLERTEFDREGRPRLAHSDERARGRGAPARALRRAGRGRARRAAPRRSRPAHAARRRSRCWPSCEAAVVRIRAKIGRCLCVGIRCTSCWTCRSE